MDQKSEFTAAKWKGLGLCSGEGLPCFHLNSITFDIKKIINNLSADAQAGSKTLRTKHDPVQMGWQVGDRIAIAKTTGNDRGQHVEITGISSFKIDIKDMVTDTVGFQPIEITSFPFDRLIP